MMRLLILALLAAPPAAAQTFQFNPAGQLQNARARGVTDATVYAPGMAFPIDHTPSYANSQVWMIGGSSGPPGSWKDRRNFAYPWADNFCESRSRATPACPSGKGHQGQDIRVGLGEKDKFWAVATENGRITNIGSYSVELTGTSGTRYRYLHLRKRSLRVAPGQAVRAGDRIGLVADEFAGTPTPVHLHFEMLQNVNGRGLRHVTPYMSLVRAYQRRVGAP